MQGPGQTAVLGTTFEAPTPETTGSGLPLETISNPLTPSTLVLGAFLFFIIWRRRRDDEEDADEDAAFA